MARDAWTDERLDDLNKRVDDGFTEVREEFRSVREEFRAIRSDMSRLFAMNLLGFLGVIATILTQT